MTDTITKARTDKSVLDLLFKQLISGHWWLLPFVLMILFLVRDNILFNTMIFWIGILTLYLAVSDYFLLRAYSRQKTEIINNKKWFQSVAIHNFILGSIVGVLPLLSNQQPNQFTIIVMVIMSCGLIIGASAVLASYITAYITWSIPLSIGIIIFIRQQDLPELSLLQFFPVLTAITGTIFAINARQLIYSSVEANLRNEELVNQAEQAAKDKSRFFASASHDLRQPLHALGLFVDTLRRNIKDDLNSKLIDNISYSTDALQVLFDALLDISRLDAGVVVVEKKHFYCKEILINLVSEFSAIANEKGLQLHVQKSDYVIYSDKILSERILRNLINNAIKYTLTGSINIDVTQVNDRIYIEIIDTGIGINENEFESIFQEFYQINNPERDRAKGLGLGLSIVKRLSDLLSLELNLEQVKPHGTKFIVSFPIGEASETNEQTHSLNPSINNLEGIHVLVIDDEVHILEGMDNMLGNWGFKVSLADSIESATTIISKGEKPQLILSDLRLRNDTTGIEAIQQVRELMGIEIPALLVSGDTDPEKLKEAQLADITLLHKPVKPALLRTALNQLLQN